MKIITLPFWMNKGELKKFIDAAQKFWDKVESWLHIPLTQFDLMTCDLIIVDYVAWQRKIKRLEGEDETIYRKRVDFAYINAQDAGMTKGISNIFKRLDIEILTIKERQPDRDWDIVTIELYDATLSTNKELLNLLLTTYGATCRRYEYNVSNYLDQKTFHGEMIWTHQTHVAVFPTMDI